MAALPSRNGRTAWLWGAALVTGLLVLGALPAVAAEPAQVQLTVNGVVDQVAVDWPASEAPDSMQVQTYVQAEGTLIALPDALAVGGPGGQAVSLQIVSDGSLSRSEVLLEVAEPEVGDAAQVVGVTPLRAAALGEILAPSVLGTHTLTILPVYWGSTDTATQASLDALAKNTAQYWSEQSAGTIVVTATAKPWQQITDPGSCNENALFSRALAANGLSEPSGKNHVLVYFPARSDCGGWAGLASIGGTHIWVNGAQNTDVVSHEFGHNLGLGHASSATCGAGAARVSLALPVTTCSVSEYGDYADVMGIGMSKITGNLNSALADSIGLAVVHRPVAGSTVTVDLAPLAQTTALRAVAVDVPGGTVYVDFRPAVGRDVRWPSWSGVQVHFRTLEPGYRYAQSYLLDMKPGLASPFTSPALAPNASWQVPGTSQVVTVHAVGSTATVSVGPPKETAEISRYVTRVYQDLFSRAPDPQGLATWTSLLARGTPRIAVANAITGSQEYRGTLIRQSYLHYLGRSAEPAGLASWLAAMGRGMKINDMEAGFLASDEKFQRAGSSGEQWVRSLYADVLGRTASDPEVSYWVGQASTRGRYAVAIGFLLSTEHLTAVVDGHYRALLGRAIDSSGQVTWVTSIQRGDRLEAIVGAIVASEEYYSKL